MDDEAADNPMDEIRVLWSRLAADARAELLRQLGNEHEPLPDELAVTSEPDDSSGLAKLLTVEVNDEGHYRASVYYRPRRTP